MLFKNITYLDENFNAHQNYNIGVIDDKIKYISKDLPADKELDKFGEIYDGNNKLLIPGFYNGHAHAAMVMLRSRGDDMPLDIWLNENNFPFEAEINAEDNYWATLLAIAEMTRFGIVGYTDMYYFGEYACRAVAEAKMKINYSEVLFSWEDMHLKDHNLYNDVVNQINNIHNTENEKIKIDVCVHSEYGTQEMFCREVAEFAKKNDLHVHLHLSETKKEHVECIERRNATPTKYFENVGMLDNICTVAHGLWITDEDADILAKHKATLVTCPASELKLGSGVPNLFRFADKGLNITIGTDGVSSSNNHNMLQAIYLASLASKGISLDPTFAKTKEVLYAATKAGALSQGRPDCGLIKKDYKADLCVIDMSEPHWMPKTDIVNNLVYAGVGTDVCLTMCDGQVVYRDGKWPFIDVEKVSAQVNKSKQRILKKLGKEN